MDEVRLDIADGEFFAILGPPGAGKTTTLRTILGLEKPDAGRVFLDDEDVTEMWPGDRDIAIVFQNLALYPDKTVFGNLAFPLKQRKLPKAEIAGARRASGQGAQDRAAARPQARQALGRRAPARRDRPRDRARPARVPLRRAALGARRAAAARDAQRAEVPAARPQPHARVRHTRPGRGHEHGRPHRRAARGRRAAGGDAGGRLPPARPTASWPPRSAARR